MPELPVDAAVANRFISSLSKSLQALCHGCMDFDTGIRIVGYINVDIDSGGAVDYVLNEKVSKGANNSISFTSNSYVSKKDQPKQTRDGSCSPVAELNVPPYSGHQRGSQPYQTHPSHSRYPYTTQSHVLRGAHKRSWAGSGGWRGSPKKQSRGRGIYANQPHYPSQDTHYQNTPDSFLQPDQPPGSNNGTDMNVKKEALDSDEQGDNMNNLNNQDAETRVNIKTDPDAVTGGVTGDPSLDGSESTNNFVEQPPGDLQSRTEGDTSSFNMPPPGSSSSNYNSGQQAYSGTELSREGNENSGMSSEYNDEDLSYPATSFGDGQGEASGDGGQFEVIEIDEEDEDVNAMFSGDHGVISKGNVQEHVSGHVNSIGPIVSSERHQSLQSMIQPPLPLPSSSIAEGLQSNVTPHFGRNINDQSQLNLFSCHICDYKPKQKRYINGHMERIHGLKKCLYCSNYFKLGDAYNSHVLNCG